MIIAYALAALLAWPQTATDERQPRPNVILVMADDLGIGDITATNADGKIKTPRIQAFADAGLVFLDAHTPSSVCTPTRYGLLTGRYNWRSRLARGVLNGSSKHLIPAERPTLGHLLHGANYHTAMIGKWHLGWDWAKENDEIDFTAPVLNGPDINGFDRYYGHSGSLDMAPYVWVDTGKVTAVPDRVEEVKSKDDPYGWYRKGPVGSDFHIDQVLPHLFSKAIEHVADRAEKEQPFFLYLALPAPHTPIVPLPPFKDASDINPYADFVMQLDHSMGELLDAVDDAGIAGNTLVVFTSDNGCSPEANFKLLAEHGHDPSGIYRGHKADIYEGGHRVPLIARWPGVIEPGQTTDALACLTDVYATLADISGQSLKTTGGAYGGEDGYSLVPVLEGQSSSGRTTLISHSISGKFAIRVGPWKLCVCAGSGGWSTPTEKQAKAQGLPPMQLFHLGDDPGETKNLAAEKPAKVEELLSVLAREIQRGRSTPGEPLANDRDVKL